MNPFPDSYPYLEPCLGCFENGLQKLSQQNGNVIFLTNGDLSVNRLLVAMAKLVPDADVTVCLYMCCLHTAQHIRQMLLNKQVQSVKVNCTSMEVGVRDVIDSEPRIDCNLKGCDFYLVSFENSQRTLMVGGYIPQTAGKGTVNLCTLYNDIESQKTLKRALARQYK